MAQLMAQPFPCYFPPFTPSSTPVSFPTWRGSTPRKGIQPASTLFPAGLPTPSGQQPHFILVGGGSMKTIGAREKRGQTRPKMPDHTKKAQSQSVGRVSTLPTLPSWRGVFHHLFLFLKKNWLANSGDELANQVILKDPGGGEVQQAVK